MRYEQLVPGQVYRMKPHYAEPLQGGTEVMYIPDPPSSEGGMVIVQPGVRVVRVADFREAQVSVDKEPPEYRVPAAHLVKPRRGRPRRYASNAERQRAYRDRRRAAHLPGP